MTKPIGAAAVSLIEAAISRLMASGEVQESLTGPRLASEAGLSRATLYRAPELIGRFRAAAASHRQPVNIPPTQADRVHQLEAEIAALRSRETEEMPALRTANRDMAQHVQALSLLVREQEQRIARLQPSCQDRNVLLRSSCWTRAHHHVDDFFPAPIALAGADSRGSTG